MYRTLELLYGTLESNMTLYVNYALIKKKKCPGQMWPPKDVWGSAPFSTTL